MRNKEEKLGNILLGLSVCSWAVLGLRQEWSEYAEFSLVRVSLAILQFVVGVLFLFRRPIKLDGHWKDHLQALPSLLISGLLFKLAPGGSEWPPFLTVVFLLGTMVAIWSLMTLGGNFAIFPVLRGIVSKGPYLAVRHPAYLAELLMVGCYAVASGSTWSYGFLTLCIPLVCLRVLVEEKLLLREDSYRVYQQKVKYRLLPKVW